MYAGIVWINPEQINVVALGPIALKQKDDSWVWKPDGTDKAVIVKQTGLHKMTDGNLYLINFDRVIQFVTCEEYMVFVAKTKKEVKAFLTGFSGGVAAEFRLRSDVRKTNLLLEN